MTQTLFEIQAEYLANIPILDRKYTFIFVRK